MRSVAVPHLPTRGQGHPVTEKDETAEKASKELGVGGRLTRARLSPKVSKANGEEPVGEQGVWLRGAGWPVSCPHFPRPVLVSTTCSPEAPSAAPLGLPPGLRASLFTLTPGTDRRCLSCLTSLGTGACRSGERSEQKGSEAGGPLKWALATVNSRANKQRGCPGHSRVPW